MRSENEISFTRIRFASNQEISVMGRGFEFREYMERRYPIAQHDHENPEAQVLLAQVKQESDD